MSFYIPGTGTIINVIGVLLGGLIGIFLKKGLQETLKDSVLKAQSVAVVFIGASGTLSGMTQDNSALLLIGALVLGTVVGELIDIEARLELFGDYLRKKFSGGEDSQFVSGFLDASLIICIGAMGVVGSIQDGIDHNPTTLITKATLDFVTILIMTSSRGKGVIFSAIPLAVYQGLLTLCAGLLAGVLSDAMVDAISFVGSAMIFCIGINMAFGKKFRVGNMLPGLVFAVVGALFM